MLTEKLHDSILMPLRRSIQWGALLIVTRIHFGPFGQKQISHIQTTCLGGQMQRRGAARGFGIDLGTLI